MFKDQVARIAYDVLRAFCIALGDESIPAWDSAPGWRIDDIMSGVSFHWEGNIPLEAAHSAWVAKKQAEGWTYAETKDVDAKQHPCLVAYDQLHPQQCAQIQLFKDIVHALRPPKPEPIRVQVPGSVFTTIMGAATAQ